MLFSADRYLAFVPLLTHAQWTHSRIDLTEQSFQPFPRNFAIIVRYPKPSFHSVSVRAFFIFLRYFTHNQRIYYSAVLHVNIKVITSQQRWYLLLRYLIIKSTFCSVVKLVLEFQISEITISDFQNNSFRYRK